MDIKNCYRKHFGGFLNNRGIEDGLDIKCFF